LRINFATVFAYLRTSFVDKREFVSLWIPAQLLTALLTDLYCTRRSVSGEIKLTSWQDLWRRRRQLSRQRRRCKLWV